MKDAREVIPYLYSVNQCDSIRKAALHATVPSFVDVDRGRKNFTTLLHPGYFRKLSDLDFCNGSGYD